MKVKELIKMLSIYNQDMEIKIEDYTEKIDFKTLEIEKVNCKYNDCIFLEVLHED